MLSGTWDRVDCDVSRCATRSLERGRIRTHELFDRRDGKTGLLSQAMF